jgi:hypothetical protein
MLVAAAACGEDSAPQQVSAPTQPDTSSNGANAAPDPVEQNPAPGAGEGNTVPAQPAPSEGENIAPPLLAQPAPAMSAAPAGAAGSGATAGAAGAAGVAGAAGTEEEPWTVLFNGQNLDGWTVSRGGGAGQTAAEIFQVTDGMLHVYKGGVQGSTQPTATIRTNDSYSNYVFQFEYMWGTARFSDRSNTDRDAGLLFHVFNDLDAVWPDSLEFQMGSSPLNGEWVSGDIFMIGSLPRAQTTSIRMGNSFVFAEPEMGGMRRPIGAPNGYERGRTNAKLDREGWNTIELTVRGSAEAEYKVNGVVVNRLFDMERSVGGVFQPLESGPIALQAEYAELFYRNIRLRELP